MQRFKMVRHEDETGISGTGDVAHGVVFQDGSAVLKWIVGDYRSTVIWPGPNAVEAITAIHGHGNKTILEWID